MKLLLGNTANVLCLLSYWFIVIFLYFIAYYTDDNTTDQYNTNIYLFCVVVFLVGSKGFTSLFIYVLLVDVGQKLKLDSQEYIDANIALKDEILSFITAGIRSSTRGAITAKPEKDKMVRRPREVHNQIGPNKHITPWFFLRFMIGLPAEVAAVEKMVHKV